MRISKEIREAPATQIDSQTTLGELAVASANRVHKYVRDLDQAAWLTPFRCRRQHPLTGVPGPGAEALGVGDSLP